MRTITFIAITLISGAIAGTILSAVNQIIVEPYIDRAIELETQNAEGTGQIINPLEFAAYRVWQRGGEIAAGTILGLSLGTVDAVAERSLKRSAISTSLAAKRSGGTLFSPIAFKAARI